MTGQLLTQRLDSILSFIETSARQSVAFAQDQAPDVVQQILAWAFWSNVIPGVICAVYAVVYLSFLFTGLVRRWDWGHESPSPFAATILIGLIPALISIVAGPITLFNVLKVCVSPKLYLIEYTASLLK